MGAQRPGSRSRILGTLRYAIDMSCSQLARSRGLVVAAPHSVQRCGYGRPQHTGAGALAVGFIRVGMGPRLIRVLLTNPRIGREVVDPHDHDSCRCSCCANSGIGKESRLRRDKAVNQRSRILNATAAGTGEGGEPTRMCIPALLRVQSVLPSEPSSATSTTSRVSADDPLARLVMCTTPDAGHASQRHRACRVWQ